MQARNGQFLSKDRPHGFSHDARESGHKLMAMPPFFWSMADGVADFNSTYWQTRKAGHFGLTAAWCVRAQWPFFQHHSADDSL